MNKKIDLTVLLKDCPSGMELDCLMYEDVYFDYVDERNIIHCYIQHETHKTSITFNQHGTHNSDVKSKCVIFPKGKTTWEGFKKPFIDGDVVTYENQIAIFKKYISEDSGLAECYVFLDNNLEMDIDGNYYVKDFATEEEKKKLFDVIREKGYRWNTESKTLENWTIQDAKDGDVLAINWYEGYDYWEKIIIFKKYHNEGVDSPCVEGYGNTFKNRKLAFHEEVPRFSKTWTSCLEPATKEQRDLLFQTIKEAGYKWNPETKTLEELIKPNFKDGDIVATNDGKYIDIIKNNGGKYYVCCHPNVNYFHIDRSGWFDRLATEEEKEKLFQYIKDNGYKWNAETKTLDKLIVPKFKVGDKIRHRSTGNVYKVLFVLSNGCGGGVYDVAITNEIGKSIDVKEQDDYELVTNKFDITTLKPFDKVLVRDNNTSIWINAFFGFYDIEITKKYPFVASAINWTQCIPYEGNEHLLGTYEDCDEYYKTWEE